MKEELKFQRLIIETFLIYEDKTWKKLRHVIDPRDLDQRFDDSYDAEYPEVDRLSDELASNWLDKNKEHKVGLLNTTLDQYYYEYPSQITKILYED